MRLASALGCSRETVGMSACGFDVSRPEAGVILAPGVHIHEAAFVPVAYFGVMDVGTRTAGSSGVSMGRHLRSGERVHLRAARSAQRLARSEEHTSELQSLMRSSYAGFSLKK